MCVFVKYLNRSVVVFSRNRTRAEAIFKQLRAIHHAGILLKCQGKSFVCPQQVAGRNVTTRLARAAIGPHDGQHRVNDHAKQPHFVTCILETLEQGDAFLGVA